MGSEVMAKDYVFASGLILSRTYHDQVCSFNLALIAGINKLLNYPLVQLDDASTPWICLFPAGYGHSYRRIDQRDTHGEGTVFQSFIYLYALQIGLKLE
jgi:hypothetical protein